MGSIVESPQFDASQALAQHGVDLSKFSGDGVELAESVLTTLYSNQILSKAASNTAAWREKFWARHQRDAEPALVFHPTSAKEVAVTVLLCRKAGLNFSVKSGGHAAMRGASSSDGGIVIDLEKFNHVEINDDKSIARIGSGGRWTQVFTELGKHGLAVAGGRSGGVGVGGYTLGGGISFFASARGWACSNVRNYELVTASGKILNVNYQSHPDLFWALRGGGSNFGIVTRFDYETFPQGDLFAGNIYYDYEHKDAVMAAWNSVAIDSDPKSATWLGVAHHEGKKLLIALLMYSEPTEDFHLMKELSKIPSIGGTAQIRSMADMAQHIDEGQAKDHYQNYWNHTFKFDPDFVTWLVDMYIGEFAPYSMSYETDQQSMLLMQFITKEATSFMSREGGCCLPLNEEEAPYVNVMFPTAWKVAEDEERVLTIVRKLMALAVEEGKQRGLYVDYIYVNYASKFQDALKGYGKENYGKLQEIALKYDPDGVFQKSSAGHFKFGGPPTV